MASGSATTLEEPERAAALLSLVLERSPRSRAELSERLGCSEAELRVAALALERHALLAHDGDAHLMPGPAALAFARSVRAREELIDAAQVQLERLAAESGETVNLLIPTADGTEAIAQVDGRHLLGVSTWVGRALPHHATAAGKLFLAFGAVTTGARPEALTAHTIVDPGALERELETVRARGYATLVDELEVGLSVVAAPVRDAGGAVIAALSVSGPTQRLPDHRLALLGRVAVEQADTMSAALSR